MDEFDELATTLQLLARRLDRLLEEDGPARVHDLLRSVRALTEDALESLEDVVEAMEVRRFPAVRIDRDLRRIGRKLAREDGGFVDVRCRGLIQELPGEFADVLLSAAREVLVHVRRHSRATVTVVWLAVDDADVVLDIRDDGVDLARLHREGKGSAPGLGLSAVVRLVQTVGGRLEVEAGRHRGVHFRVVVPSAPLPRESAQVRGSHVEVERATRTRQLVLED